jgi:hypothetical protein
MSRQFPVDVLVAMTMEELKYLESALCPSSFGADPPSAEDAIHAITDRRGG